MTTHRDTERPDQARAADRDADPTTVIPVVRDGGAAPSVSPPSTSRPPGPTPPRPPVPAGPESGIRRFLSPLLAIMAVALLPVAAATTDLAALDGWGLAKVLSPAGWVALLCAIGACLAELWARRPRIPMLGVATGVLIFCSTGMPSFVEPAARFGTAWTIAGFIDAISVGNGVPPTGVDARFYWPAFFAQWAWFRDASGVNQLDIMLRWFPPVVVTFWAIGIYALARSMLGGTRAPWVAAWLFVGLNWIQQDYLSPQAFGIVLLLTILTFALGPLATRRGDPAGVPGWPAAHPDAKRISPPRRWLVSLLTPPNRPTLPPKQILLVYFCAALCMLAVIPAHQLTPFAIIGQLALLTVVGRYRGRGLVIIGIVGFFVFLIIGARDIWLNQLSLLVGSGGSAAIQGGVADRVLGDLGQVLVKRLQIVETALMYLLGAVGALVYYRRKRDIVPIGLTIIPMAMVIQGYGNEVFFRIVLYGLPILAILGTEALRGLVRRRRWMEKPLAVGMVLLFGSLILIRGGNDSYQVVYPEEVAMYRAAVAKTPPGQKIAPLAYVGPNGVVGVGKYQAGGAGGNDPTCSPLLLDPVRCVLQSDPDVVVNFTSIEKQGVDLYLKPRNWSLEAIKALAATGKYTIEYQNGYNAILRKVVPPPGPAPAPAPAPAPGGN